MRKKRDPGFYALVSAAKKLTDKTKGEETYEVMRTNLFSPNTYALVKNDRIERRGDALEILALIEVLSCSGNAQKLRHGLCDMCERPAVLNDINICVKCEKSL